jgi:hypothetical protein
MQFEQDPYGAQRPQNPYAPPAHDPWSDTNINLGPVEEPGNYWGGFAIGFIFSLLGLIIVHFVAKPQTKTGSLHGFIARFGLGVLVVILTILAS